MRLADFILANIEPILVEWERFARGTKPGATMDALALRDHAREILLATVQDMRSAQSRSEQAAKSKGQQTVDTCDHSLDVASDQHAVGRLDSGFDLLEVVSEYRALRASVLQLWHENAPDTHYVYDVTRFNESIDQSLTKAVSGYTKRADESRDLFLAILSHDLRSPLHSIVMASEVLPHLIESNSEAADIVSQIATDAAVMERMVRDLLDYTRTRLGSGVPVIASTMDLGVLGQALLDQFQLANPNRDIRLESAGDLCGQWDADRLRQAISNLLGNAVQHSHENAPIIFSLNGESPDVVMEVRNHGNPIPADRQKSIFDPLVRGASSKHADQKYSSSMGLGLYIAREIANAHGGSIDVTSSAQAGTAFTIRLPRKFVISGEASTDTLSERRPPTLPEGECRPTRSCSTT